MMPTNIQLADSVNRGAWKSYRAKTCHGLAIIGLLGLSLSAPINSHSQELPDGWIIDPETGEIFFPEDPNGEPPWVFPEPWNVDFYLNLPDRIIVETEPKELTIRGQVETTEEVSITGLEYKLNDDTAQSLEWDVETGFYSLTLDALEMGSHILQVTASLSEGDPLIGQALIDVSDLTPPTIELTSPEGIDPTTGLEWVRIEEIPSQIEIAGVISDSSGVAEAHIEIMKEWFEPVEDFNPEDRYISEPLDLDENGAFSVTIEQTSAGLTHVIITASDEFGNAATMIAFIEAIEEDDPVEKVGDGQGPKIRIDEPNYPDMAAGEFIRIEGEGEAIELNFQGRVEDPAGVGSFQVEIFREVLDPTGIQEENPDWFEPILMDVELTEEGTFALEPFEVLPGFTTFNWTATDTDGNQSSISTFVEYNKIVTIDPDADRIAPVIAITDSNIPRLQPEFGWIEPFIFTQETSLDLEGRITDETGEIVSVMGTLNVYDRNDEGEYIVDAIIELDESGAFSWNNIPIGNGFTILRIEATDDSGNTGAFELMLQYVDQNPPEIQLTSPTNLEVLNGPEVTLAGTVSDASLVESIWVELNGIPWTEIDAESETFSVDINELETGRNILLLMARDVYGNESADFLVVDYSLGTNQEPLWTVSTEETMFHSITDVVESARAMAPAEDEALGSVSMNIATHGDKVTVSWSSLADGRLQWSNSLSSESDWIEVDASMARLLNGRRHAELDKQSSDGAVFFRMIQD